MSRPTNNNQQLVLHKCYQHHQLQIQHLNCHRHNLAGDVEGEVRQWTLLPQLEEVALPQLRVRATELVLPVLQRDMPSMATETQTTTSLIPKL